jgi:signal transduction histidine kinase/CheY-like chemotaxis protein
MNALYAIFFIIAVSTAFLLGKVLARRADTAASDTTNSDVSWDAIFAHICRDADDVAFEYDVMNEQLRFSDNPAKKLLGYTSPPTPRGIKLLTRLVHPMDRKVLDEFWNACTSSKKSSVNLRLIREDRGYVWIQISCIPQPNGKQYGVLRNVEDSHKEREALEEAKRLQTVSTMAGGIAHEFNNHLTPIQGFIELAVDYLGPKHPATEGLETASEKVSYCTQLVSQIQSYGQSQVLKKQEVDLEQLVQVAVNVAVSNSPEKAARIRVTRKCEKLPPAIFADPSRISEAINQVVQNALYAMPDGGELKVECGTGIPPGTQDVYNVYIRITDTGIGIAPEDKEHIFDPFYTSRQEEGAKGMGLSMVQGIIAQHFGTIDVKSEPNIGTAITLWLPPKEGDEIKLHETGPLPDDDTLSVLPAASAGKMLVADDEEAIRRLITKTFEADGWEVEAVPDYFEVMKKVVQEKQPYDMLVLDITMPGPTANEAAEKILETRPGLPILFISGFSRDDRVEKLLDQSRASFLGKPFSTRDLIDQVDKIMSQQVVG